MSKAPISRTGLLRLVILAIVCAPTIGLAQQSSAPSQNSPAQNGDDQKPTETLKVNVNVVQLFFNVKDKKGALIPNLTKDDFIVMEDGGLTGAVGRERAEDGTEWRRCFGHDLEQARRNAAAAGCAADIHRKHRQG